MDHHASRIEDCPGVVGGKYVVGGRKFRFPQNIAYVDKKYRQAVFLSYVDPKDSKK